jgi:hypothetical protein
MFGSVFVASEFPTGGVSNIEPRTPNPELRTGTNLNTNSEARTRKCEL